jgi:hypothetical protein
MKRLITYFSLIILKIQLKYILKKSRKGILSLKKLKLNEINIHFQFIHPIFLFIMNKMINKNRKKDNKRVKIIYSILNKKHKNIIF